MNEPLRRLAPAVYATALYFFVSASVDALANAWPLDPGSETWRYGFAGILSGYVVSLLFGLLLAGFFAALVQQRLVLRVTGIVTIVVALIFLVMDVSFILDVLQLSGTVPDEAAQAFHIGSVKTGFKFAFVFVCTLLIGIGALRAAKAIPPRMRAER